VEDLAVEACRVVRDLDVLEEAGLDGVAGPAAEEAELEERVVRGVSRNGVEDMGVGDNVEGHGGWNVAERHVE
jgi:hypothetical protein